MNTTQEIPMDNTYYVEINYKTLHSANTFKVTIDAPSEDTAIMLAEGLLRNKRRPTKIIGGTATEVLRQNAYDVIIDPHTDPGARADAALNQEPMV